MGLFKSILIEGFESNVSFIAATNGRSDEPHYFKIIVREIRIGVTKDLRWGDVQ